ncbi:MAG TPA: hypothetical protein VGK25_01400 [Ignavibacteria bacterium]
MQESQKFIIKTDTNNTYLLHIIDTEELHVEKYVGLLLYYDEDAPREGYQYIRHRILFENSVDAMKDKVIEYANGRGENVTFVESSNALLVT